MILRVPRLALLVAALLLGLAPAGLRAEASAPGQARQAAEALAAARSALEQAEGARDRVAALTRTIRAYETGLAAYRESLRQAAAREAELQQGFDAGQGQIAALLAALQGLSSAPMPAVLLHPEGPLGTARAGLLMSSSAPALNAEAAQLRARLEEAQTLRRLREESAARLAEGLQGAQQARTELSQAVSDRVALPRRFLADPLKVQLLIATTDTLRDFAEALPDIAAHDSETDNPLPPLDAASLKGTLPPPVPGTLLRRPGEADAAGVVRPGLILATPPRALVTAPAAATLRYAGPLLDYGNVIILEPASGVLIVLAGLETVYGTAGEILPAGAPLGLMGGTAASGRTGNGPVGNDAAEASGVARPETLYIEVRQANEPQDPLAWFDMTKDTQ